LGYDIDYTTPIKRIVMEAAINETLELVKNRQMMGELDHPPTPKINLKEVLSLHPHHFSYPVAFNVYI
jgi:hypothetical protein